MKFLLGEFFFYNNFTTIIFIYTLIKGFIILYIELYARSNQYIQIHLKLMEKKFLINISSLKSKIRYQFVINLKTNKYYKKIVCYLSFYLSF